jgi:2'-5' RNA ligase
MGTNRSIQNIVRNRLQKLYDQMWSAAIAKIRTGKIDLDPVLEKRLPDQRRGLTVIARPSIAVRKQITAFLDELRRLEPHQYYYTASELHITVLSLFTAVVDNEPFFDQTDRYVAAADAALRNARPIPMEFQGITASPGTVMIQGFFPDNGLNELRDELRRHLRDRGLGSAIDTRYRLETAHMTVARFRTPLYNSKTFAAALIRARQRPFGATTINSLSLVENDWYMSPNITRTFKRYPLSDKPGVCIQPALAD